MKLTAKMYAELEHVRAAERAGWIGLALESIPSATYSALRRRGLLTRPNVDGSVSLTESGWKVLS